MKRTRQEALQTRQQLLDAALDVFHQYGVARATLDQIAHAAGVTRGALYWHFQNKVDIFDALCQHYFAQLEQDLGVCALQAPPHEATPDLMQLVAAFTRMMQSLPHNTPMRQFMAILHLKCEETEANRAITELLHSYHTLGSTRVREAVKQSCAHGQLPPDLDIDMAVCLFKGCVFGIISQWLIDPGAYDLQQAAPRLLHACAHSLQHAPSLRRVD